MEQCVPRVREAGLPSLKTIQSGQGVLKKGVMRNNNGEVSRDQVSKVNRRQERV